VEGLASPSPAEKGEDIMRDSSDVWTGKASSYDRVRPTPPSVLLHHIEHGDAARFLEMMQSSAFSNQFQFIEQETGFDRLRQAALQHIGSEPISWYLSYRVRIGIK
jgi:hypothetical protein